MEQAKGGALCRPSPLCGRQCASPEKLKATFLWPFPSISSRVTPNDSEAGVNKSIHLPFKFVLCCGHSVNPSETKPSFYRSRMLVQLLL
jgi:hypothetical protein